MSNYYNCNFNVDDFIIGVNPEDKYSYLKIFKIKEIKSHDEYGREIVDSIVLEYRRESHPYIDICNIEISNGVKTIHRDYKKISTEWV